jgi:2-hydroxychromene-2-carboxylate isomerase
MEKVIDFYFDFISPFSYLAELKLPEIAKKYGAAIHYCPIDIPLAKLAAGNYGPSNREVPAKMGYLSQDLQRWAKQYGVPLNFPKGFRSPRMNAGTFYAEKKGDAEGYVHKGFEQTYVIGADPDSDQTLTELAKSMGWDPESFLAYVNSKEAEKTYRELQLKAYRRGVFGAPMMIVDDQIFWGNDRLMFLEEYLASANQS